MIFMLFGFGVFEIPGNTIFALAVRYIVQRISHISNFEMRIERVTMREKKLRGQIS